MRKLISVVLAIVLITPISVKAEVSRLEYKPGGFCEDFKNNGFNRLKIPNIPANRYLEGELNGVVLNSKERTFKAIEIKADRACIDKAELIMLQTKIKDKKKRESLQRQINSLSLQIEKANNKLKILKEEEERFANIKSNVEYELKSGDILVNKEIVDKKSSVIKQLIGLREKAEEKFAFSDDYYKKKLGPKVLEFANLMDNDPEKFNEKKIELKEKLEEEFNNIIDPFNQRQKDRKQEFKNDIARTFQLEKFKYRNKVYNEYSNQEYAKASFDALSEVITEKEIQYNKQAEDLFQAMETKVNILEKEIESTFEKNIVYNHYYTNTDDRSILLASTDIKVLDVIQSPGEVFYKRIDLLSTEMEFDTQETAENLIGLMSSLNFSLYDLIRDIDFVREIAQAIEEDDFQTLKMKVESMDMSVIGEINRHVYELEVKDFTDSYDNDTPLQELNDSILRTNFNISKSDIEYLEKQGFSADVNKIILEIARAYNGFLDFLIWKISYDSEAKLQLKKAKQIRRMALSILPILNESFASDEYITKTTKSLIKFQVLSNLEKYVNSKVKNKKLTYVLSKEGENLMDNNLLYDNYIHFRIEHHLANFAEDARRVSRGEEKNNLLSTHSIENFIGYEPAKVLDYKKITPSKRDSVLYRQVKIYTKRTRKSDMRQTIFKNIAEVDNEFSDNQETTESKKIGSYVYYINRDKRLIVKTKDEVIKELIYYNSDNLVTVRVREGIAIFYEYGYSDNLLIKKSYANAKHVWDSSSEVFYKPYDFYRKKSDNDASYVYLKEIEYSYDLKTNNVVREETKTPYNKDLKVKEYTYARDAIDNINKYTGERKRNLELLRDFELDKDFSIFYDMRLKKLPIRIEFKEKNRIVTRHDYYYDEMQDLKFIHQLNNKKSTIYLAKGVQQSFVTNKYPKILNIDQFYELEDNKAVLDGDGRILSSKSPLTLTIKNNVASIFFWEDPEVFLDKDLLIINKYNAKIPKWGRHMYEGDLYFPNKEEMLKRAQANINRSELSQYKTAEGFKYEVCGFSRKLCYDYIYWIHTEILTWTDVLTENSFYNFFHGNGAPIAFDLNYIITTDQTVRNKVFKELKNNIKQKISSKKQSGVIKISQLDITVPDIKYAYGSFEIEWSYYKGEIYLYTINPYSFNIEYANNSLENDPTKKTRATYPVYAEYNRAIIKDGASEFFLVGFGKLNYNPNTKIFDYESTYIEE